MEDCFDQIVHAQKHIDLRRTLEACIGRILELRHWMVSLNEGSEALDLLPILKDMNLGLEALEIPYPRFMLDDSSSVIEGRHKLLALVSEKLIAQDIEAEPKTPMPKERAIAIMQANERGRQN
ncbi:hypothetical protein KP509_12G038100 [Ceratopteris richardii]|uniref:Uncharacterized protein n=1 Tax=Ceratopteris richardii TaxID=49495 RepID=A0A8T2TKW8_CERRI|nr:hypothetical protein KP509_12G038100 [Ceratopteris richardii]